MRFYANFIEAQNEIKRDLKELGVRVHPDTMQHFDIKNDPDFDTLELENYMYAVGDPDYRDIEGVHEEWVEQEWKDRLNGGLNPGHAWKKRKELWLPLMEFNDDWARAREKGKFAYAYSERMGGNHIRKAIEELEVHPNSRQIWIPVWQQKLDEDRRGKRRVPCSLGYFVMQRNGKVNLTYVMRSCDFSTHYPNDAALAVMLQEYIAHHLDAPMGTFTHIIFSLHVYQLNVKDVF
jgi:thymidylate synthase